MRYSKFNNELTVKYILPQVVITSENVDNAKVVLEDADRQPILGDLSVCRFIKGSSFLLDFGKEIAGGVDITLQ